MSHLRGPRHSPTRTTRKATRIEIDAIFDFMGGRTMRMVASSLGTSETTLDKILSGGQVNGSVLGGIVERAKR